MAKKKTKKKEKEKQQKDQESKGGGESAGGGKSILSKLPTWFYVALFFFFIPNALGYVLLHPRAFHCIFFFGDYALQMTEQENMAALDAFGPHWIRSVYIFFRWSPSSNSS